jgi:hypothetical protein
VNCFAVRTQVDHCCVPAVVLIPELLQVRVFIGLIEMEQRGRNDIDWFQLQFLLHDQCMPENQK